MLGYRDWAELKLVTNAMIDRLPRSTNCSSPSGFAPRHGPSCRPHRLFGPSSSPGPWVVEYRGVAGRASVLEGFRLDRRMAFDEIDPLAAPAEGAPT